jgi:hypothetical protein
MGAATAVGNCDDACTGITPHIIHPPIIPANTAAKPETNKRSIVTSV